MLCLAAVARGGAADTAGVRRRATVDPIRGENNRKAYSSFGDPAKAVWISRKEDDVHQRFVVQEKRRRRLYVDQRVGLGLCSQAAETLEDKAQG